jgi:hypothetical protein
MHPLKYENIFGSLRMRKGIVSPLGYVTIVG